MSLSLIESCLFRASLGLAAYLIAASTQDQDRIARARIVLRVCTAITLMWSGAEIFAFPEWRFDLHNLKPNLSLGLNHEFFMVSAGFIEFSCAYLILTGMLLARAAAFVLLFFFVSAIYSFGLIDAIGHLNIIIVLMRMVLSRNPTASLTQFGGLAMTSLIHTMLYFLALFLFIQLYNAGHFLSYQI